MRLTAQLSSSFADSEADRDRPGGSICPRLARPDERTESETQARACSARSAEKLGELGNHGFPGTPF